MIALTIPLMAVLAAFGSAEAAQPLSIATFQVDATPPIGSALCIGFVPPVKKIVDPLTARGIILLTDQKPIVICAVDWVEINNDAHDEWRKALAEAAGTTVERVTVHTLHQHDTPVCDFFADKMLQEHGIGGTMFDVEFTRETIARTAEAVREAMKNPRKVTHIGVGKGKVEKFASNRRIPDADGKIVLTRMSSCTDPEAIAAPEGIIDPYVRDLSFWDGDRPVVSMTYYASHPQSFYGRGAVSYDTVGVARAIRESTLPDVDHIHFDGAAADIAAGKYNNGSPKNRLILAQRLVEGMEAAWADTVKYPITAADVEWRVRPTALPLRQSTADDEGNLRKTLANSEAKLTDRLLAAFELSWIERCKSGHKLDLTSLRLGPAYVLHMPGELCVEYQLAAQKMRPDSPVFMAAYSDCGMEYICTEIAYSQGGYEPSPHASRVAPEVEGVLMEAMSELLGVNTDGGKK